MHEVKYDPQSISDPQAIYDHQAESGVIASLLYDPELIVHSDFLEPDAFYDKTSAIIYYAIKCLYLKNQSIDSFTISQEIKTNEAIRGNYEDLSMPSIDEIKNLGEYVKRENPEDYIELAKEIMNNAYKRQMVAGLEMIIKSCYNRKKSVAEISNETYKIIDELSEKFIISDEIQAFGDKIDALWKKSKDRANDPIEEKLKWKWDTLNSMIEPERGEMILIEGAEKAGKSMFLMDTALNFADNGVAPLIIDSEMTDDLYLRRVLTFYTGVDDKTIKHHTYNAEQKEKIDKAIQWIKDHPFYHEYSPDFDKTRLYAMCRLARDKKNVPVVVYDYLKCDDGDASTVYNKLGQMANTCKNDIGGRLDMAVIAGAQLNRNGQVADSIKLEKYASAAIRIYPKTHDEWLDDGEECGNCKVIVKLNRLGKAHDITDPKDYFDFHRIGEKMRFKEAKQHSSEPLPF